MSLSQTTKAGCFSNREFYLELTSKKPNLQCIFVGIGSNCIGGLEAHIRNYCDFTLTHDNDILYNYDKYIGKNKKVSITTGIFPDFSSEREFKEIFIRNDTKEKIILTFKIKNWTTEVIKKFILFLLIIVLFIFIKKKYTFSKSKK